MLARALLTSTDTGRAGPTPPTGAPLPYLVLRTRAVAAAHAAGGVYLDPGRLETLAAHLDAVERGHDDALASIAGTVALVVHAWRGTP